MIIPPPPSSNYAKHLVKWRTVANPLQSWLGKYDDQLTSHGEAIAYMLKLADLENCKSKFERDVLMTLSVPVVCISYFETPGQIPVATYRKTLS